MTVHDITQIAKAWLQAEPDDDIRAELQELIDGDPHELAERFSGRLTFGTAGLRAEVGAGPLRMNRLVARQAAAGLAAYLLDTEPDAASRGVIIGYDARRKSDVFARDTARVMAARGIRARVLPAPLPTPVLAWSLTELNGAAAVMVTASHNPPADNGYKVYLGDGARIVPPHDAGISEQIELVDPTSVELAADDDPLIETLGDEVADEYVASIEGVRLLPDVPSVPVAYTPMHGVGGETACAAFERAGFGRPFVVEAQFRPDPSFPTVAFPNPEEPGAMDLVTALASEKGALIAIANDPDADRLGAAIPQPDGSWRRLGGDEIGWLLAKHILDNTSGADRLVVTTLVSSSLLGKMAKHYGVHAKETFTGFKWIGRTILDHPDLRFVLGYEQALGYLVTQRPLDKDGISAAVMLTEVAAVAAAEGTTLQAMLDGIAEQYGRHVTGDKSVRMDPVAGAKAVEQLQASPPKEIAGAKVTDVVSYPEADLLRFELAGGVRVQVRPSGTEPKVKFYGEAVNADPTPYIDGLIAVDADRRGRLMAGVTADERERLAAMRAEIARKHLRPREDRPPTSVRGVHHLALISADVQRTVDFYQGVLEFPLTEMFENRDDEGSTHFFFDIGNGNALAFFDLPGLDLGPYAEVLGGLHHLAISVEPERWQHLKENLDAAGVPYQHVDGSSLYFLDPDGARLELISDPLGEMYGNPVF